MLFCLLILLFLLLVVWNVKNAYPCDSYVVLISSFLSKILLCFVLSFWPHNS